MNNRLYQNTRQTLVAVYDRISRKSQKNTLDMDYNETVSTLNCLKDGCIAHNSIQNLLSDYAKESNVQIQGYSASESNFRESYQKMMLTYKISGGMIELSHFLSRIKQHRVPISCSNIFVTFKENNVYQMQLMIIERKNLENKTPST